MFLKKTPHRIFDYTPQHYKKEVDEKEIKKRQLGFSATRKMVKRKKRSPIIWIGLLLVIFYFYLKLQGII